MTNIPERLIEMIKLVANALGPDMLNETAFVGGCTTGLLLTDSLTKETVRYTEDVDLIIDVIGYPKWVQLQENLRKKGFKESMSKGPICRMLLNELEVDFMPIDESILGFSNIWYRQALESARPHILDENLTINLLTPPLFVATKLEAYQGRGNDDPIGSRDIEDIIILFDGREEIVNEITNSDNKLKDYIASHISSLLEDSLLEYPIQSQARNSPGRDSIIYNRLAQVSNFK